MPKIHLMSLLSTRDKESLFFDLKTNLLGLVFFYFIKNITKLLYFGELTKQYEDFFNELEAIKQWRESAAIDDPKIFFLKDQTDNAAAADTGKSLYRQIIAAADECGYHRTEHGCDGIARSQRRRKRRSENRKI